MRKFIFSIFYFLIIILLFNGVVFVFANDNYYKGYHEFPDKSYHAFLLADSHGMPLEKFPEKFGIYNFSSNSDSYADMERKITYLIDHQYQVKKIYISADDHTLSPYRESINNMDKSIVYTSKINFNYIREKYIKYYFPIFQLKVNSIFRMYLEDKVKIIFNQKEKTATKIIWSELSEEDKRKRASDRVLGQFPSKIRSQKLEKTLVKIITLCQQNNIELIGVKFPVTNSYLKKLGNQNYGADKVLESKEVKMKDYKSIFDGSDDYFGDQDHLNPEGAEKFVKILFK